MLFGPDSLVKYIKFKNSLWFRIRESYRELQLHQKALEKFLMEPVNPFRPQKAERFFMAIISHWVVIAYAKRDFEGTFHRYKLTTPSDLEMALYRQYLLFGKAIMDSCTAGFAKAGFTHLRPRETD